MQQDGENLNIMIHRQMGGRLADQPGENQAMQKIIFHTYPSFTNMIFPPRAGTGTSRRFEEPARRSFFPRFCEKSRRMADESAMAPGGLSV